MSQDGQTASFLESRVKERPRFSLAVINLQFHVHAATSKYGRTLGRAALHGAIMQEKGCGCVNYEEKRRMITQS